MTAFNIGDRVCWPAKDGWHSGYVLRRRPFLVNEGEENEAMSLRLTLRDEDTGRIIERGIRGCCAMIPGTHVIWQDRPDVSAMIDKSILDHREVWLKLAKGEAA